MERGSFSLQNVVLQFLYPPPKQKKHCKHAFNILDKSRKKRNNFGSGRQKKNRVSP